MAFNRIKKINYEPGERVSQNSQEEPQPTISTPQEDEQAVSRADNLIEEFDKTIEFIDWLTGLVDDKIKDVVVEVSPEEHPEIWMAMTRIFGDTANEKLSGSSYVQVLDAIRDVNDLELEEATSANDVHREFINSLPSENPEPDSSTPEMDVIDEDAAAIASATEARTFTSDGSQERSAVPRRSAVWWRRFRVAVKRLVKYTNGTKTVVK